MWKVDTKRRGVVFFKTLRRGFVCSLIPVLVMSGCVFVFQMHQSVGQLGNLSVNMLAKNDQLVMNMLEDMNRSARNLAKDPSVVDFAMRPYLQDVERNSNLYRILSNLEDSYEYVDRSFLLSTREMLQIDSLGRMTYGERLTADYLEEGEAVSGFQMQFRDQDGEERKMLLSIGIPADSSEPVAVAVLQVNLEKFLAEAVGGMEDDIKRNLYIFDQEGNQIFSDIGLENLEATEQKWLAPGALTEGSHLMLASSCLVQYSLFKSQWLGWRYVYISSAAPIEDNWLSLAAPLLVAVLTACAIGALLAYQNSKVLYSPLEQLISSLSERSPVEEMPQDEYQLLANYYDSLLSQRDEVYEQADAIRPLLLKKFLVSLMSGTQSSQDEILYQIRVLEIPFQPNFYNVFLLQIDHYDTLPCSEEEKQEIKAQLQAQIAAHSDDLIYCITAEVDVETLLIVCNLQIEESRETAQRMFSELAEEIQKEAGDLWSITVTLGIGCLCRSAGELPLSCKRAKAALAYKLYRGEGSVINFDEVKVMDHQVYHDFEKIRQVINGVRTGDGRNIKRFLNELFEEFTCQKFSPEQVFGILQYLISGIGEVIQAASLTETIGTPEELTQALRHKTTLPDIEVWLTELCVCAAAAMKSSSSERTRNNAERIKDYIDKHLTKDVSLSSISEYVNYSPTYVSKVFRQCYGISYIDYLNSSRVRRSREFLLQREDLSVKEIGFKVGFNNLQTFFRIFKKYTGMTPMQYRETAGGANSGNLEGGEEVPDP